MIGPRPFVIAPLAAGAADSADSTSVSATPNGSATLPMNVVPRFGSGPQTIVPRAVVINIDALG
jgi:hypothetical protein